MQTKRHVAPFVVMALLFFATFARAETLHVPKQYATIQACIDAAVKGDECVVAPGTYNEVIDFLGKAITLRSSHGADATIIDGTGLKSSVVKCVSGEGPNTVLDGFTITGGTGSPCPRAPQLLCGGGMINDLSSPTVISCAFSRNAVTSDGGGGGGMFNDGSSPTVTNCTFNENDAYWDGGGMLNVFNSNPAVIKCTFSRNHAERGGGMLNVFSKPTVTNCVFSGNTADRHGGAMTNFSRPGPTVTGCTFLRNTASERGGAMYSHGSDPIVTDCTFAWNKSESWGGGMGSFSRSSPIVTGSTFVGNAASEGGGIAILGGGATVTNCTFSENQAVLDGGGMFVSGSETMVTNCTFSENQAVLDGGGMFVSGSETMTMVTNCTFSGNHANRGGGILGNFQGPIVTNCILWGDVPDEIRRLGFALTISYSDIEGSGGSGGGWDASLGMDGGGNIDADPLFVDQAAGDFRLRRGSPAIDAGNNEFVPADITTDLDGSPRFVDDPAAPDTGVGDAPIVDMGAYEFQVDCDGNGLDDDEEIAADPTLDCDANGKLDACEEDRDQDGDGVLDDCDECPGSSAGETIVINGCETRVVNQVFDDGCTMVDELAACGEEVRNHGAYVSCVARVANSWRRDGMISNDEHGRVVSCAAKQHTGRNLGGASHVKKEPDSQK